MGLSTVLLAALGALILVLQWPTPAGAQPVLTGATSPVSLTKAKTQLLRQGDLPKGWNALETQSGSATFPGAAQLASCLGVPAAVIQNKAPSVSSPDFTSENGNDTVQDTITLYRSRPAAAADFDSLANPKTPACMTTVLNGSTRAALERQFGSGATVGTITVGRAPASAFASGGANFTAQIPVTEEGQTLTLQLVVVDYVHDVEEQTVTFSSIEGPFPATLAKHLTVVASSRI